MFVDSNGVGIFLARRRLLRPQGLGQRKGLNSDHRAVAIYSE
jgi:hypothetical protein